MQTITRKISKSFFAVFASYLFTISALGAGFQYGGIRLDAGAVTAANATTSLSNSSAQIEIVSGTTTQTIKLPDATTLKSGYWYDVSNKSTYGIAVQSNSGTPLQTLEKNQNAYFYLTSSSTAGGAWDVQTAGTYFNQQQYKQACNEATATALPTNIYANGLLGVGATLTATANGALTVDGISVALNDRILVKNEVTAANNGIYFVTATGGTLLPYVLTRAFDFDQPQDITQGVATLILTGATNATPNPTTWALTTTTNPVIIGTTALNFTELSSGGSGGSSGPYNINVTCGATTADANTQLLLNFDQSPPQDFSTNLIGNGNLNTGVSISSAQAKFGASSLLPPAGDTGLDYTSGSSAAFNLGSGAFTVEYWLYYTASPANGSGTAHFEFGSGSSTHPGAYVSGTSGHWRWLSNNGTSVMDFSPSTQMTQNVWHHVAWERSGTTLYLFWDGVQEATASDSNNYNASNGQTEYIGYSPTNATGFSGYIDEFRVSNIARYATAGFTPPSSAFPITGSVINSDSSGTMSGITSGATQGICTLIWTGSFFSSIPVFSPSVIGGSFGQCQASSNCTISSCSIQCELGSTASNATFQALVH